MAGMRDMRATGATARQVDYWTRLGYLEAVTVEPGSGNRRLWRDREVEVCRRMVRLTDAGLAPDVAVGVARGDSEIGPGIFVFVHPDSRPATVDTTAETAADPETGRGRDAERDDLRQRSTGGRPGGVG